MSDSAPIIDEQKIAKITKRGFDPRERLKKRGLRKATITVYLDEDKADEMGLGRAEDIVGAMNQFIRRERVGVLGDLDQAREELERFERQLAASEEDDEPNEKRIAQLESEIKSTQEKIKRLEDRRDEILAELEKTGLIFQLRSVPPVIEQDTRRKAKQTLGITEKNVPDEKMEEFSIAQQAHLMAVMIQSVTDIESGEVNTETTYEDAIAYIEELPKSQFARLDQKMGELQFTDAISRSIESQEDFS